jgi:lipopolysaccharide O-acetyltransferase
MLDKLITYGFIGSIRLIRDLMLTRIFFRRSRLIRTPFYIRGSRYIDFGESLTTGINLRLDAFLKGKGNKLIIFGDNCQLNDYVHIGAIESITIGDNVLIASKVFITDHNHGDYRNNVENHLSPVDRKLFSSPVHIGNNVWLGEGVMVMPGVSIGNNVTVGAGSIVTKSLPDNCLAVGVPAKVIRKFMDY